MASLDCQCISRSRVTAVDPQAQPAIVASRSAAVRRHGVSGLRTRRGDGHRAGMRARQQSQASRAAITSHRALNTLKPLRHKSDCCRLSASARSTVVDRLIAVASRTRQDRDGGARRQADTRRVGSHSRRFADYRCKRCARRHDAAVRRGRRRHAGARLRICRGNPEQGSRDTQDVSAAVRLPQGHALCPCGRCHLYARARARLPAGFARHRRATRLKRSSP